MELRQFLETLWPSAFVREGPPEQAAASRTYWVSAFPRRGVYEIVGDAADDGHVYDRRLTPPSAYILGETAHTTPRAAMVAMAIRVSKERARS